MLLAGDELSHTQQGNNNAYCQDNDRTWLDWDPTPEKKAFLEFVREATRLWREQPVLKRRTFFQGRPIRGSGVADVAWFAPGGAELTDADWEEPAQCLGVRLAGDLIGEEDEYGEPIAGDTLLVLLNAQPKATRFVLPATNPGQRWELLFDTADDDHPAEVFEGRAKYPLRERSVAVLRTRPAAETEPDVTPLQAETLRRAGAGRRNA
jgi:glycogen operon protein